MRVAENAQPTYTGKWIDLRVSSLFFWFARKCIFGWIFLRLPLLDFFQEMWISPIYPFTLQAFVAGIFCCCIDWQPNHLRLMQSHHFNTNNRFRDTEQHGLKHIYRHTHNFISLSCEFTQSIDAALLRLCSTFRGFQHGIQLSSVRSIYKCFMCNILLLLLLLCFCCFNLIPSCIALLYIFFLPSCYSPGFFWFSDHNWIVLLYNDCSYAVLVFVCYIGLLLLIFMPGHTFSSLVFVALYVYVVSVLFCCCCCCLFFHSRQ